MKRINIFLNGLTEPDSSNPTVLLLAEFIRELEEKNQLLKDENARLKNNNSRPKIRPSTLDGKDPPVLQELIPKNPESGLPEK